MIIFDSWQDLIDYSTQAAKDSANDMGMNQSRILRGAAISAFPFVNIQITPVSGAKAFQDNIVPKASVQYYFYFNSGEGDMLPIDLAIKTVAPLKGKLISDDDLIVNDMYEVQILDENLTLSDHTVFLLDCTAYYNV